MLNILVKVLGEDPPKTRFKTRYAIEYLLSRNKDVFRGLKMNICLCMNMVDYYYYYEYIIMKNISILFNR